MGRDGEYAAWIEAYLEQGHAIVGECRTVAIAMREAFPELELRGGFVQRPLGRDLHYWLRAPSGEIVDPTAAQFPGLALDDYNDADTTDPVALLSKVLIFCPDGSVTPRGETL